MPHSKGRRQVLSTVPQIAEMLKTLPACVWTTDRTGIITHANALLAETLGYDAAELLGRSLLTVLDAESRQSAQIIFTDILSGTSQQHEALFRSQDGRSLRMRVAAGPLWDSQGQVSGVLGVGLDITEHWREEQHQKALLVVYQAQAERERLLNKIGQAVRAAHDPERVQQIAMQLLGTALQADRCYYSLYHLPSDQRWIGEDYRRPDLPSLSGHYRISDYEVNPADYYTVGRTLIIEDCRTWPLPAPLAAAMESLRVRSMLAVPLFDDASLVATLTVAMADTPRAWTEDELSLVEAVATQTRSAIEAARIEKREREIAEQLQTALLPTIPAQLPGLAFAHYYQPALDEARVGGDFIDVFIAANGEIVLIVGDVSGKGLEAAAQVGMVRPMLHFALDHHPDIAQAIGDMNQTLERNQLLRGFTTLFAARYDHAHRRLKYVNCGQEPALVRRSADNRIEVLSPTGPILGIIPEAQYQEKELLLDEGDTLAIFTDGLTDAGRQRHASLEVSGVAALLAGLATAPPQATVDQLIQGADQSAQGGVRDDVCLLVAVVPASAP